MPQRGESLSVYTIPKPQPRRQAYRVRRRFTNADIADQYTRDAIVRDVVLAVGALEAFIAVCLAVIVSRLSGCPL